MKKITVSVFAILSIFSTQVSAQIRDIDNKSTDQYFEISKNIEIFTNIFKELNKGYVDPIEPGKMVKSGVNAMLAELDPYTNYFTETDKQDFEFQSTGKYGGIGVGLQIIDSNIYIGEIFENGPAHKAGLIAGDKIISINEIKVTGKSDEELSLLLRGAPGTKVEMEVINPKSTNIVKKTLMRDAIEVKSVPLSKLIGDKKDIAYVFLNQFSANCAADVESSLNKLKDENPNLKGVVLDLRDNPGGLLHEAVKICNLFIPQGKTVVTTKGKSMNNFQELKTENTPWNTEIPLTILINSGSASASEVVSGTIQDYDRGVVIGVKSFGKGLVQNVVPLGYNTSLKLTTAKYYIPSGRCIQAIDYSHRNADGSVSSIPDSLKKQFKTAGNRTVFDGGGIEPDILTKDVEVNRTLIALMADGKVFNYATDYFYSHEKIAPAEQFMITDQEFENFVELIEKNNFNYKSVSEEYIKILEELLKKENYLDDTKTVIDDLNKKITQAKRANIIENKAQLKKLISNEIVSRYYYQKGRALHRISTGDDEINKAIDIIKNAETNYYPLLLGKK